MIIDENEIQPAENKKKGCRGLIIALLASLLIASVAGNLILWSRYNDREKYVQAYEDAYSVNYFSFDSITVDSFKKKVASGEEFIVMITRPGCSNCQFLEQPFIRLANQKGIADKIYHLNVALLRRDNEAWAQFKSTYGLEGTPTYARFAKGRNISSIGWTYELEYVDYEMVDRWISEQSDFFDS